MKWLFKSAIVILATIPLYEVILSQSPDTSEKPKQTSTAADKPAPTVPPFHPNAVARSLTAAPGAVVCADLQTVSVVFHLYAAHWEDSAADAMTKGQAGVVRGPAAPTPDPKLYGCSLLVPGTPVRVENADAFTTGFPRVTANLPDGTIIHGVTLPAMLSLVKSDSTGTALPVIRNSPGKTQDSATDADRKNRPETCKAATQHVTFPLNATALTDYDVAPLEFLFSDHGVDVYSATSYRRSYPLEWIRENGVTAIIVYQDETVRQKQIESLRKSGSLPYRVGFPQHFENIKYSMINFFGGIL